MRDLNRVFLIGHLGRDPEQRETKKGNPVVNFSLATSKKFKNEAAEDGSGLEERTEWHRVVVWGKLGDRCMRFIKKGALVCVEGEIRTHSYSDKSGVEKIAFEVHADDVHFLSSVARREEVPMVAEA